MPTIWFYIGLVFAVGSALIQIAEEWKARGLTDTSFVSLWALVFGMVLLMVDMGMRDDLHGLVIPCIVLGVSVVLLSWKFRDSWKTMKRTVTRR